MTLIPPTLRESAILAAATAAWLLCGTPHSAFADDQNRALNNWRTTFLE
jgi:hypothetical protein